MDMTRERCVFDFTVSSYESDVTGTLSLFSLLNRFQDLAGIHAAHLGVGYAPLRERRLGWILSRILVTMDRLPAWNEAVTLTTWPKGIDRLFAMRDFILSDAVGAPIVRATTAWLLVDTEKLRPQRVEQIFGDLVFPGAPEAVAERPDKLAVPERSVPVFDKPVWLSDLDVNRHVNNAQYGKWISDCFPEEQYRRRRVSSLQINYLEETAFGDTVRLSIDGTDPDAPAYTVAGTSVRSGRTLFHSRIGWSGR